MKVLHVLFTKGWGGLEKYAIEQARAMSRKGHEIFFLRRKGSRTAEALRGEFGDYEFSPVKYIDIRVMFFIRSLIRRNGISVVHVHNSGDLGLVVPALWGMRSVRLIFSSYMQIPAPKKDFYHRFEYGRVDRVLVSSEIMRDNAVANLPVPPEKIEVAPYGLDMGRFDPTHTPKGAIREKYGIGADKIIIGVISRLEPLKGQMEMIEAMPRVIERFPNAVLVLVGDETPELIGKYKHTLEEAVERCGVAGNVIFTGYATDTSVVLADIDLYVLPSHSETFSLGCLEAMAMAKPVIGANAGGTPEMLGYGETGMLAEPKNPSSLADAVIRMLSDPAAMADFAARARAKVETRYDMNVVMNRLHKIYLNEI